MHHQMRKLPEKRFKSSNEKQLLQILRMRMIMQVYLKLSLNSIKSSCFFSRFNFAIFFCYYWSLMCPFHFHFALPCILKYTLLVNF